jgi:transcriptional regulator with XRE-family HTH domain
MRSWGERVRALREATGTSQERFGILVGASLVTVNRWEMGRVEPADHAPLLELMERALEQHAAAFVVRVLMRAAARSRRARITALVWLADEGPPSEMRSPPSSSRAA